MRLQRKKTLSFSSSLKPRLLSTMTMSLDDWLLLWPFLNRPQPFLPLPSPPRVLPEVMLLAGELESCSVVVYEVLWELWAPEAIPEVVDMPDPDEAVDVGEMEPLIIEEC